MKYRFYFQEFSPQKHKGIVRLYHQTEYLLCFHFHLMNYLKGTKGDPPPRISRLPSPLSMTTFVFPPVRT